MKYSCTDNNVIKRVVVKSDANYKVIDMTLSQLLAIYYCSLIIYVLLVIKKECLQYIF